MCPNGPDGEKSAKKLALPTTQRWKLPFCRVLGESRFFYNEEGKLSADDDNEKSSPLRELLFQAVSRAREELTLIITGDPALFARINALKLVR